MARVAVTISLSDWTSAPNWRRLSRRRKTSQGLARRARIVLAAAEPGVGEQGDRRSSRGERGHRPGKWRRRYAAEGLDGL